MSQHVDADMAYEQFMKSLFGAASGHGYVDGVSFATWRKDLIKIVRNLRRSVQLTVHTDTQHMDALLAQCDVAMAQLQGSETPQEAANAAIRHLTQIAFLLVGELPDHYNERHPAHDTHWILNRERQIGYSQSLRQRVELIRRLAREGALEPELNWDECNRKYHELNGSAQEFLKWLKDQRPQAYLKCL